MPRAGGIYTLPPGYFAVDGTTIEVSQHNPPLEDIAQALTDSLPRDGSAPMTGNLAMGSNKITGLAAGTNPADAVRFDQLPTVTPTTATLTAGTNAQGQGPITTDQVTITVAAANPSGATLPTAVAGDRVIIANRGANPVNIYPATGAAIGALATNAPVLLAVNQSVEFFARSATQWEGQISQPLDADLTAVAALSTTGLIARTAAGAMATRQITSADGSVTITNPAGVAGDIDLSAQAKRVYVAPVSMTAVTSVDIATGLPAGVNEFEVRVDGVSSTTGNPVIQLGTSVAYVTSGYVGGSGGDGSFISNVTEGGMAMRIGANTRVYYAAMRFRRVSGDTWLSDHNIVDSGNAHVGAGRIVLGGTLTRVRITQTGTFTAAGSVSLSYGT